MSGRAIQVLARFPAHLEAPRQGKQLGVVADAIATLLDELSTDLAGVRRSHRLADADTIVDVERLGALHRIGAIELDAVLRILAAARKAAAGLADADDKDALLALTAYAGRLEAVRARVQSISRLHERGNGNVRALIEGAASALGLDLDLAANAALRAKLASPDIVDLGDNLFHSVDLFWHSSLVSARAPIAHLLDPNPPETPLPEVVGIEENPLRRQETDAKPRVHAELFAVYRQGFGRDLLRIEFDGITDRTFGPMLVNRDEGRGIGFAAQIPDGSALVIHEDGRGYLDDIEVTAFLFAWKGACFAANDDDPAAPHDFVFDGPGAPPERKATFAVATPPGALDGDFVFPHAGDPVPVPGIGVGKTRFAFLVQQAHFSPADDSVDPPVPVPFAPRTHVGFLDESVFATPPSPGEGSAVVKLSWLEHEAYAVRVIIPKRFSALDGEGPTIAERVRRALERHRAVGVEVRVDYLDDAWALGKSPLSADGTFDPILALQGGTVLSPPGP